MLKQKARIRWKLEGDENSKYFHASIRRKYNKSNIRGVNVNGMWNEDPEVVNLEVFQHFKSIFSEPNGCRPMLVGCPVSYGPPTTSTVSAPGPRNTADQSGPHTDHSGPSNEKSRPAPPILSTNVNGADTPSVFVSNTHGQSQSMFRVTVAENESLQAEFSEKEIWDAINECASNKAPGPDEAINQFWSTGSISSGCNSSFITLVPKNTDSVSLNEYRPISLIGSLYKVIAKLLSIRIRNVILHLVDFEQSAFIKGRNIIDGVLIANEILEYLKNNRLKSLVFKVNFKKAFDSLNWDFLDKMMALMGFGNKWPNWISSCLKSASISVLVNGSPTKEFKLERGVRQGDPFFPFLFINAAKGLNWLAKNAVSNNLFSGVEIGRDKINISHLQYTDDTIFSGSWSMENIGNLMKLLKCFVLSSGLKVNYNKSNLFGVGIDKVEVEEMANLFGCNVVLKKLKSVRRKFFWGGAGDESKISWVKRDDVIRPLADGGLNVGSLFVKILALIGKWWWRFYTEPASLWVKTSIISGLTSPSRSRGRLVMATILGFGMILGLRKVILRCMTRSKNTKLEEPLPEPERLMTACFRRMRDEIENITKGSMGSSRLCVENVEGLCDER
ncbi:uncharacterized protein [Rutidosis leptorrhynchoides]|uniref:uncharacterized protein n=1 Tax=Rutidosis leptorrhynchoides TaxID=125765 RepID=UPI003A9904E0